ncbi:phosphate/phosphite/phosphonate ABC transporter substrate-binding protein [Mycolicibacterium mengxianglii]|uniref:phosphate/phosphite/phosphonate ABC transporter substrate-binding protein n=1 Tax=Mycolicibacterium mengxianglii TaxID=2736649 RepID=UPI0018EF2F9F|nr:phosphate/phosphite/phosphonate ABC transporter substrate-binding protein [Mycolicibacterium mengxianglii]
MLICHSSRSALIATAAVGLLVLSGCSSSDSGGGDSASPDTLTFASIPQENASGLTEKTKMIVAALEKRLGVKIETQQATSYAAVIEALRAGQVDIAALGPFSYAVAADSGAGVALVGVPADSPDESPSYQSYAITKPDSGIKSLSDMAGKTVCFVDPTSTSGYLFPSAGLLEVGIDPETGVTPVFAGGHDASALSVLNGTCDAGFAYDTMIDEQLPDSGQLEAGALQVIWESEDIPKSPIVVSTKLPKELQDGIAQVFQQDINRPALVELGLCATEADCQLPEDVEYGYIPAEDSTYDGIRQVCDITKSKSCVV